MRYLLFFLVLLCFDTTQSVFWFYDFFLLLCYYNHLAHDCSKWLDMCIPPLVHIHCIYEIILAAAGTVWLLGNITFSFTQTGWSETNIPSVLSCCHSSFWLLHIQYTFWYHYMHSRVNRRVILASIFCMGVRTFFFFFSFPLISQIS